MSLRAVGHVAPDELHNRMVASAAAYVRAAQLVTAAGMAEPDPLSVAATAMQGLLIAISQAYPDDTGAVVSGLGLGIGSVMGDTCARVGQDVGPHVDILQDGIAQGVLVGASQARPQGTA